MSANLPLAERAKLQKLIGLLGSDKDGERAAALAAASRLLDRNGVRWSEILPTPSPVVEPEPDPDPPRPRRNPRGWRYLVACCCEHSEYLNGWEREFLFGLPGFYRLSSKQDAKLHSIADKLRAFGCRL